MRMTQRSYTKLLICTALLLLALAARVCRAQCEGRWLYSEAHGFAGTDEEVRASVEWDPDGPGPLGSVVVFGGAFTHAGALKTGGVAVWDGTDFSALPGALIADVHSLAVYRGELIAAGTLVSSAASQVRFAARWTGSAWEQLGTPPFTSIRVMCAHNDLLYASGFAVVNGSVGFQAARWNGESWSVLPNFPQQIRAMMTHSGGDLIIAGIMNPSLTSPGVARWDGQSLHSIGAGARGEPYSLAELPDGSIIVGGFFAGTGHGTNTLRWDGTAWRDMPGVTNTTVRTMALHEGALYASVHYENVPLDSSWNRRRLGRWNGAEWEQIEPRINSHNGTINSIRSFGGRLLVAGRFYSVGGAGHANITAISGDGWQPLAEGLSAETMPPTIYEAVAWKNSVACIGNLVGSNGIDPHGVTIWNGVRWSTLGEPFDTPPYRVIAYNDDLYAFGPFVRSGETVLNGIARWDGTRWVSLDGGVTNSGAATNPISWTIQNNELIVCGPFTHAGSVAAPGSAAWDGTRWRALPAALTGGLFTADNVIYRIESEYLSGYFYARLKQWEGAEWRTIVVSTGDYPNRSCSYRFIQSVAPGSFMIGGAFTHLSNALGPYLTSSHALITDGSITTFGPLRANDGNDNAATYCATIDDDGRPILGGFFNRSGTTTVNSIARLVGTQWQPLRNGLTGIAPVAQSLVRIGPEIVATGMFTLADGRVSPALARWTDSNTPWIALPPLDTDAPCNQPATLGASLAHGYDNASVRWQIEDSTVAGGWRDLVDGVLVVRGLSIAEVSGAETPDLVITPRFDAGVLNVRAIAHSPCGQSPSSAASIRFLGCDRICQADYNLDGAIDTSDVIDLANDIAAGTASFPPNTTDFNNDGGGDTADIIDLANVVAGGGCP